MRVSPLLLIVACVTSPDAAGRLERVPGGEWGGEHVRLTVEDSGARVEFDCAHGSLDEPLAMDADGRFDVKGSLVFEGGPARKDETAITQAARYRGRTDGRQMSLVVTLGDGQSAGEYSLAKGGRARLFKCR